MTTSIGEAETASPAETCAACGFAPGTLTPSDAMVAVRSFPGRFSELLAEAESELVRRPLPTAGWSALEHAGHVRDALHALDMRLQRLLRDDCPCIPETPATAPVGANEQGRDVILAPLRLNAQHLARTMSAVTAQDWERVGLRCGRQVQALDLAREAVHEGTHHLRAVERGLAELRARRSVS